MAAPTGFLRPIWARGLAGRVLARWERLAAAAPAWAWLVGLWFLLVMPLAVLRGAHFEEGTVIALARGAVEDGHWLAPHLYGLRFVERPVLLSWIVAALNTPLGRVDPVLARLPTVLALLGGVGLVFWFVRRYAAVSAALFAAASFLVSPMILQKLVTAEPDLLLSVMLFAAFVVWWLGFEAGALTGTRWVCLGLLLGAAGLVKGPQPLAYFFLGVGAFTLLRRRWADIAGLAAAGAVAGTVVLAWYAAVYAPGDLATWRGHGRVGLPLSIGAYLVDAARFAGLFLLETLPAILLVGALALGLRRGGADVRRADLVVALLLYAFCCTLVLAVWPGVRTRYAMPAAPALAALAGLAFERVRTAHPQIAAAAVMIAAGLAIYQIALNWVVMPLAPERFQAMRSAGEEIAAAIRRAPAPLYVPRENLIKNPLLYVQPPIRAVSMDVIAAAAAPAWALLAPSEAARLAAMVPGRRLEVGKPIGRTGRVMVRLSN